MSQLAVLEREPERVTSVDRISLRNALGCFATGVAIVTTRGDGDAPVGLTISSFNSVSLDPPLVLWSIANTAPSLGAFRGRDSFAINILAEDQLDLCQRFSRPSETKFAGVDFLNGYDDVPLLTGAAARFECRTYARYPGGDHEIYLGEVVDLYASDKDPLVFHKGQFAKLGQFDQ